MAHVHSVKDTDVHYKIDGITRTIININETKRMLVQNDHNSERLTFEVPRFVDGHDLTACNVVQVHYTNADTYEENFSSGVYEVDDLGIKSVSGNDANIVVLSWLVSGNATKYIGTLNFIIRFSCVTDGIIEYAWNTTVFKGITILEGIFNSNEIVEQNTDILEQWKRDLFDESEEGVNNIGAAEAKAIEAIDVAKNKAIDVIPSDYQEMYNKAVAAENAIGDLDNLLVDGANLVEAINNAAASGGGGLSQSAKDALLNCFRHVAWIDTNGATYLSNLETALNSSGGSTAGSVESITAVYTGGSVGEGSDLSELKKNLVVTATYSDGTESIVSAYALSGTIGEGTNTITVTYRKVTTTFTVEGIPSYTVINNLTNVTNSNSQTSITDGFYSATLTVEDGFILNSVVITMGGVDVTDSVYTAETGSILITEVTGDIVITAVAEKPVAIETVSKDLPSERFYDGADDTSTKVVEYTAYGANITSCRATESECVVSVTFTNETENDITATAYIGAMRKSDTQNYAHPWAVSFYHSVLAFEGLLIGAGQSRTVQYTLPAEHHLHAYATNQNLTVSAFGALDILEIGSDYALTSNGSLGTVYADDTTTTIVRNPGGATKYQTDVFDTDTTVRVTLLSETYHQFNIARTFICCYSSGAQGYYAKEFAYRIEANMPYSFEYTVKAGYRLATCIEPQYVFVENIEEVA